MTREIAFSELCGFTERQWEATAVADKHAYTLFGGTRGPGKSYWLRWVLVRFLLAWAARGIRNVRVGLFCESYPALTDRQITKIATFPAWLGTLQTSQSDGLGFFLRPEYGGGALLLRNLDRPDKYQSAEFAAIGIDELTKNQESTFHVLRGSLRWPGIDQPKFYSGSNSNGIGQKWVRQYFLERVLPPELKGNEAQFAYLPARPGDNPHLPASYWDMLKTLPDALRRSWLDGDWYVTMEGLVYADFGAENITPVERDPDPGADVELAFDDGYIDPRAILFIQRTGNEIFVFDEIYHSKHLAETCVGEVVQIMGKWFGWADDEKTIPKKLPQIAVGSPEAKELQERFRLANIPARKKVHKIVDGIQVMRALVKDGNGHRAMQVHPRCKNFIEELTAGYQYPADGSKGKDEVPIDANNHAADAFRSWACLRAN